MSNLHAIVYVSSAIQLLSNDELDYLLKRARARNLENEVTGLLLYSEGNFMQYIEGSKEQLLKIYEIIKADKMHHKLIELMYKPVDSREFSRWSMAYTPTQMHDFDRLMRASWGGLNETDDLSQAGSGRVLLRCFWHSQNQQSNT